MKLFQVLDMVREHVGRDKLGDDALRYCVERGLRAIETHANFYWMERSKYFEVNEGQQVYSIASDLYIDDYKDTEMILVSDRTADDPEWHEVVGPETIATTKGNFAEGDEGQPAFWSLNEEDEDPSFYLWPPLPDQPYRGFWAGWCWTTLPESTTSEAHEVLRRWPDALIYMATAEGVAITTKDLEAKSFWERQFINPVDQTVLTEYKKIKLYQEQRRSPKRHRGVSTNANTTLSNKLAQKEKLWF